MTRLLAVGTFVTIFCLPVWAAAAGKEMDDDAQVLQTMTSSNQISTSLLLIHNPHSESLKFRTILGGQVPPPESAKQFLSALPQTAGK
jgi:hypothetical protein